MIPAWEFFPTAVTSIRPDPSITCVPMNHDKSKCCHGVHALHCQKCSWLFILFVVINKHISQNSKYEIAKMLFRHLAVKSYDAFAF